MKFNTKILENFKKWNPFSNKHKYVITFFKDGNLEYKYMFFVLAKNEKEAKKIFNSCDLESRYDIDDIYEY